jgi:hypothetical protein
MDGVPSNTGCALKKTWCTQLLPLVMCTLNLTDIVLHYVAFFMALLNVMVF